MAIGGTPYSVLPKKIVMQMMSCYWVLEVAGGDKVMSLCCPEATGTAPLRYSHLYAQDNSTFHSPEGKNCVAISIGFTSGGM